MKTDMLMPQMGESIAEATILKWLKRVGDKVEKDEAILEISTDKVDSEIPAPASGIISEIIAQEGSTVAVKSVIAIIDSEASSTSTVPTNTKTTTKEPTPEKPPVKTESETTSQTTQIPEDRFYSPLVKSLAAQHSLSTAELESIKGTGAQGRVSKADVMQFLEQRHSSTNTSIPTPNKHTQPNTGQTERPNYGTEGTKVEPMDRMRKLIAEHMVRSKATSPHVYTVAEVDVTNIARWREEKQPQFLSREGFKLSFTPFFLEATAKALVQFPLVNASVDGENIILKKNINLGCAVALGNTGLIVPVIKNANQLSLVGLACALNDLANRARTKKLSPDDTQNGTFTLTNPGVFGNIMGFPIINQPQLGILGIGAIKKRPVVVNNMIAIRDMLYLTLSYDHRVVDGSLGGQFVQYIAKYLENWSMDRELY